MEILVIALIIGFVGYVSVREGKSIDFTPRINKRHFPRAAYLKSVREDTEIKSQTSKLIAADKERVKKKLL